MSEPVLTVSEVPRYIGLTGFWLIAKYSLPWFSFTPRKNDKNGGMTPIPSLIPIVELGE